MQVIYYGAPGTGKSFEIDAYLKDKHILDTQIFRTTFHPEYSYSDFVGQLLPKVVKEGDTAGSITYAFSKGIFTKAIERAYLDTSKEVFLILEEMSRGNCAAIFGDIFQLLDREKGGKDKGYSRYFICNELIAKDIIAISDDKVRLPANLSIIGTVNTSDQNVFTMDTAFKRRFEWKYVSTKPVPEGGPYENSVDIELYTTGGKEIINWIDLYGVLNKFISDEKWLDLGEDKQLGQFFVEFDLKASYSEHKIKIQNKLLHYLWEDIHKISFKNGIKLFADNVCSFSELYDRFEKDEPVFSETFFECIQSWKKNIL